MRILITGNMGYVGPPLVKHLRATMSDAYLIGYDQAYFGHCLTGAAQLPERFLNEQLIGDVRNLPDSLLGRVDALVELAAISNDPMGDRFAAVTDEINSVATVDIATRAAKAGVKRIVFASSCSVYGYAVGDYRDESSPLNPLTAYARSKVDAEGKLMKLDAQGVTITSLRFGTACGMSDRLRLDLVLNDFVACAASSKHISVLSDGTPWRPLIEVRDMARSIEWALTRNSIEGGPALAINVGSNHWNFQIGGLAEAVAHAVPGARVSINSTAPKDSRSYAVDFSLYQRLAPKHQPVIDLEEAIRDLKQGLERMGFDDSKFRSSSAMRLKVLEQHIAEGRLTETLTWARARG